MKLSEPATKIVEAAKRLDNITKGKEEFSLVDEKLLTEKEEVSFYKTYEGLKAKAVMYHSRRDYVQYFEHLHMLAGHVDPFLDAIRINVEDEQVKRNRINLCRLVLGVLCEHLDWRKLYQ